MAQKRSTELPPAIGRHVAGSMRIPAGKQEIFVSQLIIAVKRANSAVYKPRVKAAPVIDHLARVSKATSNLERALGNLAADAGPAQAASTTLEAFLTANQPDAILELAILLDRLRRSAEAAKEFVRKGYPGRGNSDSRARNPAFSHLVVALEKLAKGLGGRATINKGAEGTARKWSGSLLTGIELLRDHLPCEGFFPNGQLGAAIDDIVKS